jgi:hypothetical protein
MLYLARYRSTLPNMMGLEVGVGCRRLQSDSAVQHTQRRVREPSIATIGGDVADSVVASIASGTADSVATSIGGGGMVDSVATARQTQWRNPLGMVARFRGAQGESAVVGQGWLNRLGGSPHVGD